MGWRALRRVHTRKMGARPARTGAWESVEWELVQHVGGWGRAGVAGRGCRRGVPEKSAEGLGSHGAGPSGFAAGLVGVPAHVSETRLG